MTSKRRSSALIFREGDRANGTITVTEAGIARARQLTRLGHPINGVAAALGMSGRVLRECRKRQPELDEALEAGLAELEGELVHSLLAAARKGVFQAAMFLLKCRHGYRETGATDQRPAVAVQINLPGSMDERAYARAIASEARVTEVPGGDN